MILRSKTCTLCQLTLRKILCTLDAVESDLRAAFTEHGTVAKIQMPLDRNTVSSAPTFLPYSFRVYCVSLNI